MAETTKSQNTDIPVKCNSCCLPIDHSAKVCHHCGQPQKWWRKLLRGSPIVVSIVMMAIAGVQLTLAFRERVEASKAVKTAKKAAIDANLALTQAQSDANEINTLKKKFELISELQLAVIATQSGNRKAYDKLKNWGHNESYEYSDMAFDVYKTIDGKYATSPFVTYIIYSDPNNNLADKSFSELSEGYSQVDSWYHADFVNHIWKRNNDFDFSKKKKLEFLISVLQNDESLTATYYAGKYIAEEAKLNWNPFYIQPLMDWWEENREKDNKNPEDQPTDSNN